ncbi:MAG TPA: hypothetical protein PKX00_08490 [Opitutaceae bacterium]|nr:hypothetical protein [Opitutaceae bacterium]
MHRNVYPRRRFLIQTGSAAAAALLLPVRGRTAPVGAEIDAASEAALTELWRRWVTADHGTVIAYAALDGQVILPTAEDCAAARPNGMSWCTPISDGPLTGGLLLDGLCLRWNARRSRETAAQARQIARGLVALGRAGRTPGFVARGFAADGRGFYPASSEDQVMPWVYGLWRYARSELPEPGERREIVALLEGCVRALEAHAWQVPCEPRSFGYRGNFIRAKHKDTTRILFLNRALHELTGRTVWMDNYRRLAKERIGPEQRTRIEWCAEGMEFVNSTAEVIPTKETASVSRSLWTSSLAQAALRGLWELETDPGWRRDYARGLSRNAHAARPHLAPVREHAAEPPLVFDGDWRTLNTTWRAQVNCDEAIVLGRSQLPLWEQRNPRLRWEDNTVREPLFAAWIMALGSSTEDREGLEEQTREMLARFRWPTLFTSGFAIVVNLRHQLAVTG